MYNSKKIVNYILKKKNIYLLFFDLRDFLNGDHYLKSHCIIKLKYQVKMSNGITLLQELPSTPRSYSKHRTLISLKILVQ